MNKLKKRTEMHSGQFVGEAAGSSMVQNIFFKTGGSIDGPMCTSIFRCTKKPNKMQQLILHIKS